MSESKFQILDWRVFRICGCVMLLCLLPCLTGRTIAQDYRLTQVNGTVLEGAIEAIDANGVVAGSNELANLRLEDLVSIEPVARSSVSGRNFSTTVLLVGNGQLAVTDLMIDTSVIRFQTPAGPATIPIEAVRAIVWESSSEVQAMLKSPSNSEDAVLVRQGEGVRGVHGLVEGLTAEHVLLNYKGKTRKIGLDKVSAVVMADLQQQPVAGTQVRLKASDWGQVQGVLRAWKNGSIEIAVGGEAIVSVPSAWLSELSIASERLVYLSDLEPVSSQQQALFTIERAWKKDLSIEGRPLTLLNPDQRKPVVFNKGIGTHAWSSLVFANDRDLDLFSAVVGIDTETNGRGNCRLVVRGDGIELWSGEVTGGSGWQAIDVDIKGMELIELEVLPGKEFDLADHANWCNARFLKSGK